jgi:hypothetical protein
MTGENGPRLARTLTLGPVVLFGLAYIAPMIVLGTFGVLAQSAGNAVPTAYLVALVAMLFTATSHGRMAAAYRRPLAVLVNLVVPLIGAGIDVWPLTNLDSRAIRLGRSRLAIGIVSVTRGFRRPPPEMDFAEEEPEPASA